MRSKGAIHPLAEVVILLNILIIRTKALRDSRFNERIGSAPPSTNGSQQPRFPLYFQWVQRIRVPETRRHEVSLSVIRFPILTPKTIRSEKRER